MHSNQDSSQELTMENWLKVFEELPLTVDYQSIKDAFIELNRAIELENAMFIPSMNYSEENLPIFQLNAEIITLLQSIKTQLIILELENKLPLLVYFCTHAEKSYPLKDNIFKTLNGLPDLPTNVHDLIFGGLNKEGYYTPGYINLEENEGKKIKNHLVNVNRNGYRIFHEPRINKLLNAIVTIDDKTIEKILKKQPELFLEEGCVTDLSGQIFYRVKPFELARWLGDVRYLCPLMLKCLPKSEQGEEIRLELIKQCQAVEEKGLCYKSSKGELCSNQKPFDYSEIINALQTYIDNYDDWTNEQCQIYWCKVVGYEQRNLPAHAVADYCDSRITFYPLSPFNQDSRPQGLNYYNSLTGRMAYWFAPISDSEGLSVNLGMCRGSEARVVLGLSKLDAERVLVDLLAIKSLSKERTNDLERLKQQLQMPIQKQDTELKIWTCSIF